MSGDEKSEVIGNILGGILGGFLRIGPTTIFRIPNPMSPRNVFALPGGGTFASAEAVPITVTLPIAIARPTVAGTLATTSIMMAMASTGGGGGGSDSSSDETSTENKESSNSTEEQKTEVNQAAKSNSQISKESAQTISRTPEELDNLARDPAHGNQITPKGIHEKK